MAFPVPSTYSSTAADIRRDEDKRTASPPSFFFGRGWGLVLAANYFTDARLAGGYSAVAAKHRQRIQSATFGMLMAAFEWCVKDFIAQVIDAADIYDENVEAAKWIELEKSRVLAQREATASIGAILIHPTQGWHDSATLRARYTELFERSPVANDDMDTLDRLWLLRHSVAHNAGFVTHHDAYRMRAPDLSERSVRIDEEFIEETWEFLSVIVRRLGHVVGEKVLEDWLRSRSSGDYGTDVVVYDTLKKLISVVESRNADLPEIDEAQYIADRTTFNL